MSGTYQNQDQAAQWLQSEGFTKGPRYWSKAGRTDPFFGAVPVLALVTIERRTVAPAYGGGEFFELKFH